MAEAVGPLRYRSPPVKRRSLDQVLAAAWRSWEVMTSGESGGAAIGASIRSQQDGRPFGDNDIGGEDTAIFLFNMQTGASHTDIHDFNIVPI
jgi:hypothetical protein